jgi:predicted phage replisome organizer
MSETKKYYWLKLKNDYFQSKEIKKLRLIAGGDTYTIIYLKLQLLSIKDGGMIIFEGTEDNIAEQLAIELDEKIENIKMTLSYLMANKLIEQINNDEYLLNKVPYLIGSETDAAERMRKHRDRKKLNADVTECNKVTDSCNEVTQSYIPELNTETNKENNQSDKPDYVFLFDKFWQTCKRKVSKEKARNKYRKLLTHAKDPIELHDQIMDGMKKYNTWIDRNKIEIKYVKHPSTWLNSGCWEDELDEMEKPELVPSYHKPMGN